MKTKTAKLMSLAAVAICGAASQSLALGPMLVYDSFEPIPTSHESVYNSGNNPTVRWLAQSFVMPAMGGNLIDAVVSLYGASAITGTLTFDLYNDHVVGLDHVPNTLVANLNLTPQTSPINTPNPSAGSTAHYTYLPGSTVALTAGQTYWVVAEPHGVQGGDNSNYLWDKKGAAGSTGSSYGWAQKTASGWEFVTSGVNPLELQVNVDITEVPEPGVMLTNAVILSAIGFGGFYYRRRAAAKA
jgi:hypothetical protein